MSDAANASAAGDATGANGSPEYIKLKVVGQVILFLLLLFFFILEKTSELIYLQKLKFLFDVKFLGITSKNFEHNKFYRIILKFIAKKFF